MFDGTNLILISDVDQDTKVFGSHERSLTHNISSPGTYKSRYKKEIQIKIKTQQYIQLNTGAK